MIMRYELPPVHDHSVVLTYWTQIALTNWLRNNEQRPSISNSDVSIIMKGLDWVDMN